MSYNINPAKATYDYIKRNNYGINKANDTCFGLCNAFGGGNITDECSMNCQTLINNMKLANDKSPCSYKLPRTPPIFETTPHYFPALLSKTRNVEKAKSMCIKQCKHSNNPQECAEWCCLEAASVVQKEPYKSSSNGNDNGNDNGDDDDDFPDYKPYADAHPVAFYIAFSVIAIIFSIIIVMFIKGIFTKDD